jgi:hypothetical protein
MVGEADGRWHPDIGDPTLGGWITVIAYFGTALLAYRALRFHSRNFGSKSASTNAQALVGFWLLITGALVLLGINKQLDLQSWFTEVGRDLARAQGWYEGRRSVQALFVAALVFLGLIGTTVLFVLLRPPHPASRERAVRLGLSGHLCGCASCLLSPCRSVAQIWGHPSRLGA